MARFIRFPGGGAAYVPSSFTFDGVGGTFLSTPDVNLLNADTAHFFQSKGDWFAQAGLTLVQDTTPNSGRGMGGLSGLVTMTSADPNQVFRTNQADGSRVLVGPGVFVAGMYVKSPVVTAATMQVRMWYFDSGNANIGNEFGATSFNVGAAGGSWVQVVDDFTAPANTVTAYIQVRISGQSVSDTFNLAEGFMAAGSDKTFIPSLDIVGDIEMEAKASSPSSANQTLMATWGGSGSNGYQFGANLSGNLLARHGNGSVDRFASGSNALTPGVFQTVKGSFDAAGNWSFDIDGVSETVGPTTPGAASPSGGLSVGSNAGGTINLFTGDISSAVVRDGVGGPTVASFLSDDYTGGAGAIPNGTTFIDSVTGRVWTANGNIVNVLIEFGNSIATESLTVPNPVFIVKNPPSMPDIIDGDRWIIGNQWAGDGFTAQMHDGTDATGPIVAEFDAEDIGL